MFIHCFSSAFFALIVTSCTLVVICDTPCSLTIFLSWVRSLVYTGYKYARWPISILNSCYNLPKATIVTYRSPRLNISCKRRNAHRCQHRSDHNGCEYSLKSLHFQSPFGIHLGWILLQEPLYLQFTICPSKSQESFHDTWLCVVKRYVDKK